MNARTLAERMASIVMRGHPSALLCQHDIDLMEREARNFEREVELRSYGEHHECAKRVAILDEARRAGL